jgi:hypothetical protein
MKRLALIALMSVCVLSVAGTSARADVLHYVPSPSDLYDLNHYSYYTWGMTAQWQAPTTVVAAKLTITQIGDWTSEDNVLYIHLLDSAPLGVRAYSDNQGGGDNFAGQGVLLKTYLNLPVTPQNLSYEFTPTQLAALNSYAADGAFALGLDPDCHFYNSGVELEVTTQAVQTPEPGTLALLVGGAGLAISRRRRAA